MEKTDGLLRGLDLRQIVFSQSNTPEFPSNMVTNLYESRDGDLWIGFVV
jgi:hypothetical protein